MFEPFTTSKPIEQNSYSADSQVVLKLLCMLGTVLSNYWCEWICELLLACMSCYANLHAFRFIRLMLASFVLSHLSVAVS